LIGEAIASRGVREASGSNVEVACASKVSMGISVGVENVGDGVSMIGVARGVLVVWFGKLHEVNTKTRNGKTVQRVFIYSSFSDEILIRDLDYRNSSLGQVASFAHLPAPVF